MAKDTIATTKIVLQFCAECRLLNPVQLQNFRRQSSTTKNKITGFALLIVYEIVFAFILYRTFRLQNGGILL